MAGPEGQAARACASCTTLALTGRSTRLRNRLRRCRSALGFSHPDWLLGAGLRPSPGTIPTPHDGLRQDGREAAGTPPASALGVLEPEANVSHRLSLPSYLNRPSANRG